MVGRVDRPSVGEAEGGERADQPTWAGHQERPVDSAGARRDQADAVGVDAQARQQVVCEMRAKVGGRVALARLLSRLDHGQRLAARLAAPKAVGPRLQAQVAGQGDGIDGRFADPGLVEQLLDQLIDRAMNVFARQFLTHATSPSEPGMSMTQAGRKWKASSGEQGHAALSS